MSSGHVRAVMAVIFAKPADGTGIPLSKRLPLWGPLMLERIASGGAHVDGSRVHALHPTVCSSIATRWLWCGSCRHTHRLQRRVSWQFRADNGPGLPQRISDDCSTFRRGQKEFNVTGLDLRLAIRRTNACAHEVVETEIGVGYRLAV